MTSSPSSCSYTDCLLCTINSSPDPAHASFFTQLFKDLPLSPDISLLRTLWSTAMAHPDDSLLVHWGLLDSMTNLIHKGLHNPTWLSHGRNVYIPYYAAHILGSYTMNVERHALHAVRCRAVGVLAELARGGMTWVEQRVAVRCLSHLASYDTTFPAVAAGGVLPVVMSLARDAAAVCYEEFVGRREGERREYHRELLTRGGGGESEMRKAEEWASQLQCWSLQVVNCFALREEFVLGICRPEFVVELPGMWGGLVNGNSPAGVGLLRTICCHKIGRMAVASWSSVVEGLCNVARSSDDWQLMAVECLIGLLQDHNTRFKVFTKVVVALADLVELTRASSEHQKLGETIMDVLLSHDSNELAEVDDEAAMFALEEVTMLRKRMKAEKHLSREDIKITQAAALVLRLEGNARFSGGDVRDAAGKYTEALDVCPVRCKKDRIIILNNRAQCFLLMGDAERAVSDTTRAVCLCRSSRKSTRHGLTSSLWRRAQAYDMLGLAKESLLDALLFGCTTCSSSSSVCSTGTAGWDNHYYEDDSCDNGSTKSSTQGGGMNFYVLKLVRKQMRKTWLFRNAARQKVIKPQASDYGEAGEEDAEVEPQDGDSSGWETASNS